MSSKSRIFGLFKAYTSQNTVPVNSVAPERFVFRDPAGAAFLGYGSRFSWRPNQAPERGFFGKAWDPAKAAFGLFSQKYGSRV